MKYITLILLACCSCHAQAVRLQYTRLSDSGEVITGHGTASVLTEGIVTAAHNCEYGNLKLETAEGWVKCSVVRIDADTDIAVLKTDVRIKTGENKDGCFGSVRGKPVQCLKAKLAGTLTAVVEEFDLGCSGAPLFLKGKLVGICVARLEHNVTHELLGVRFVPAVLVRQILEAK